MAILTAILISISGCTALSKPPTSINLTSATQNFDTQRPSMPVPSTTFPQASGNEAPPIPAEPLNLSYLEQLAITISNSHKYQLDIYDCTQFTMQFVNESTKAGYKCRYASGTDTRIWNCHSWPQCELNGKTYNFEVTPPYGGLVTPSGDLRRLTLCTNAWGNSSYPTECERNICRLIREAKNRIITGNFT